MRLAQALSLVALVAALVGALGPAERVRTTYSWPPSVLPEGTPEQAWYTPLLLTRHRPEALSATVPCTRAPSLSGADADVRVLATARDPGRAGGLELLRTGDLLTISVGDRLVARAPLTAAPTDEACSYRLELEGDRWSLAGGPASLTREGELEAMPAVFGFFSDLDLRAGPAPAIAVRTAVHATRTTTRQSVAWVIATFAIAGSLLLIALERKPGPPLSATGRALRAGRANAHPADGVVALGIVGWWLLAPAFFDDGWIYAKLSNFSSSGGFSSYFVFLGTNAPLGYWLDWLLHWLAESTNAVALLRIPALLCVAATWVLCRWVLARALAAADGGGGVALWALASAFLAGTLAWGMTLRPEPMAALLVTAVLACVICFLERRSLAPLAIATALVPLAVTAHPSGIVALAPLLAALPTLARFARRNVAQAAALVGTAIALSVMLLFVGADLDQRRVDTQTISALDTATSSWLDETYRYELLTVAPYGTPLRRALVALIALALVAFVLRRRSGGRGVFDLPSLALGIGILLLIPTPSKWPSHFGTFIGLIAVAAAVEMAALRKDGATRTAWSIRPLAVLGVATVAGAWPWLERAPWNVVDLRTLDWRPAVETVLPLWVAAAALPLLALGLAAWLARRRGDSERGEAPWRAASWTAALVAVPLLAFTITTFARDTATTSSWTHASQTLESLRGSPDCGLGEDLLVPSGGGDGRREPLARRLERHGASSLVLPNLVTYFPCARLPVLANGVVEIPDIVLSYPNSLSPIRYPLTSPFVGLLDVYRLRELPFADVNDPATDEVVVFEVDRRLPGALEAPVEESTSAS